MGSSPIDKKTMNSSSSGALGSAGTLANNGQTLTQTGINNQNKAVGAVSGFLNPSSMNVSAPTGADAVEYQNEKNQNALSADQALATTNRNLASRGLGQTPAGFNAANMLQAYLGQANANQQAFQNATTNSQNRAIQNFWNAANLTNGSANTDLGAGNQALQGSGSIYDSLYGTSSQQKQNPFLSTVGALGSLAGGVGSLGSGAGAVGLRF